MEPLEPSRRRALRAKAHHLDPVVTIGHHGLTPAVLHEIDVALVAHELVKVRVLGDDRAARAAMLGRICRELDCAEVQQIGKLLVLWRPAPAELPADEAAGKHVRAAARPATTRESAATTTLRAATSAAGARNASRSPAAKPAGPRSPRGVPRAALPRRRRGI